MKLFGPDGQQLRSVRLVLSEPDAEALLEDLPIALQHEQAERDEARKRGEAYEIEVTALFDGEPSPQA
jgi:hypothetical protein